MFDAEDAFWVRHFDPEERIQDPAYYRLGAVAGESTFFLKNFLPSPAWAMEQVIGRILSTENLAMGSLTNPEFTPSPDYLMEGSLLPPELLLFLKSRFSEEALRTRQAVTGISVFGLHQAMRPAGEGQMLNEKTIDLMKSNLWDRLNEPDTGFRQGIHDSVREWMALANFESIEDTSEWQNTFSTLIPQEDAGWVLLEHQGDWETLIASEPAPPVLTRAWEAGDLTLLRKDPGKPFGIEEHWWQFSPASGHVLVRDLQGRGSALSSNLVHLSLPVLFASSYVDWAVLQTQAIKFSMAMAGVGFMDCFVRNLNFACCGFMAMALFAMGAGLGKLMLVGAAPGAVVPGAVAGGIGFDLLTSPLNPFLEVCPNLRAQ